MMKVHVHRPTERKAKGERKRSPWKKVPRLFVLAAKSTRNAAKILCCTNYSWRMPSKKQEKGEKTCQSLNKDLFNFVTTQY